MSGIFGRLFGRSATTEPRWVEVEDLRARLAEAAPPLVLDVREAEEFEGPLGHIEGARNIPLQRLDSHYAALVEDNRPIVCVCLTDKRSATAAAQLTDSGFRDVAVLRGGMKAWREG
jgi:rhodanese-related sulfurtransferase